MADFTNRVGTWTQTLLAVGSLVFGVGMLYGDVQDIKRQVSQNGDLEAQTKVLEERIASSDKNQAAMTIILGKLSDNVESLSKSVARLEGKLEK